MSETGPKSLDLLGGHIMSLMYPEGEGSESGNGANAPGPALSF